MAPPQTSWQNGVQHAVRTDVGLRRLNNQDSFGVVLATSSDTWQARGHLFVVADGMGAHAAGELASKLATDTIAQTYRKLADLPPSEAILAALQEANAVIHGRGEANAEFHGMGTTASVLLLLPQGALVAHVGDSRVYRLRAGRLDQLTYDHSLVWEMMSSGNLNTDQVPAYLPKNIITRSLGPSPKVEIDREGPFPLADHDTFLLCSDGLSGQVTDDEIGQILLTLEPQEAVEALVDLANLRGGPDNITAIVVKIVAAQALAIEGERCATPGRAPNSPARIVLGGFSLVLLLAALVFSASQAWIPAAVSLAAGLICGLCAALSTRPSAQILVPETRVGQFGRGPYRTRLVAPDAVFIERLREIDEQLRQATADEGWSVDWNRFNKLEEEAKDAARRADFAGAISGYCRAISFVMNQLRHQRNKQTPPPASSRPPA